MKKLISAVLGTVILCGMGATAIAQRQPHHKKAPANAKKAALMCPVTGTKIASLKAAVGHSAYKGKTYYFCCAGCKPRFDKNPGKYVANAAKGKFEKM